VASAHWQIRSRGRQRCRDGLLRGDGDASGNIVLDRQVIALKSEANAILG
jgi:hypothetical protein